jgi:hypothetical protein
MELEPGYGWGFGCSRVVGLVILQRNVHIRVACTVLLRYEAS